MLAEPPRNFGENDPAEPPFLMKIEPDAAIYFRRLEALANLKMTNTTKVLQTFEINWNGNIVSTSPTSGYINPGETVNIKVSALIDEYECDRHYIAFYHKPAEDMKRPVKEHWQSTSKPEGVKRIWCFFNIDDWFWSHVHHWSDADIQHPFLMHIEPNNKICFRAKDPEAKEMVSKLRITNTTKELHSFWIFHTTSIKFRIIPPYGYIEPDKSVTIEVDTCETASAIDQCLLYIVHGPAENRKLSPDQFCFGKQKFQGYKSLQCSTEDDISFPESQLRSVVAASSVAPVTPEDVPKSQPVSPATPEHSIKKQPVSPVTPEYAFENIPGEPPFKMMVRGNICFSAKDLTAQPNIVDVSITNTTKVLQAFKVKTTSYEIFRVSTPMGYLSPGHTVTIRVIANLKTVPAKRHFIAFYHLPAKDTQKMAQEIWKTTTTKPEGAGRIRCSFKNGISFPEIESKSTTSASSSTPITPDRAVKNKPVTRVIPKHPPNETGKTPFEKMVTPFTNLLFTPEDLTAQPNIAYLPITSCAKELQTFMLMSSVDEIFDLWPPVGYISPGQTVTIKLTATAKTNRPERHCILFIYKPAKDRKKPAEQLWQPTPKAKDVLVFQCFLMERSWYDLLRVCARLKVPPGFLKLP
ncbi:hypothetical protein QR680_018916 [Steinernema hermaphroditum]|uniref:MSP domain-containing protein n=1 Tax=Steinernema hermaphroditum TaxID=289476 RepID=A0AA39HKE5_9BILA|nr:hypothetical protein QR680_018916 [Steinernema hermaphroditum]